jgi:hypothetical protein
VDGDRLAEAPAWVSPFGGIRPASPLTHGGLSTGPPRFLTRPVPRVIFERACPAWSRLERVPTSQTMGSPLGPELLPS